jgi:hypothetical protein
MGRDNFTCRCCGETDKTLHVHHKSYEKNMKIWDSEDSELVTLCKDCHDCVEEMVHDIRRIGDKLVYFECSGISQFQLITRIYDLVNTAYKKPKWGRNAFRLLDTFLSSLICSSLEFDEAE